MPRLLLVRRERRRQPVTRTTVLKARKVARKVEIRNRWRTSLPTWPHDQWSTDRRWPFSCRTFHRLQTTRLWTEVKAVAGQLGPGPSGPYTHWPWPVGPVTEIFTNLVRKFWLVGTHNFLPQLLGFNAGVVVVVTSMRHVLDHLTWAKIPGHAPE